MVEEAVSPGLMLAMRAMYQTSEGALLMREGTFRKLRQMSGGEQGGICWGVVGVFQCIRSAKWRTVRNGWGCRAL